jgi:hypothetical protein
MFCYIIFFFRFLYIQICSIVNTPKCVYYIYIYINITLILNYEVITFICIGVEPYSAILSI